MATILRDRNEIPKSRVPASALKPPVIRFSHQDAEHPEEADEFIAFLRESRRQPPRRIKDAEPPAPQ